MQTDIFYHWQLTDAPKAPEELLQESLKDPWIDTTNQNIIKEGQENLYEKAERILILRDRKCKGILVNLHGVTMDII